jgi:hypothetical protein
MCLAFINGCAPAPDKIIPGEMTMHFPFAMAIKNNTLLVSSQSIDNKYGYGRLIALDTELLSKNLAAWQSSVIGNTLIPLDVGLITYTDRIIFASKESNSLYAAQEPLCNSPAQSIEACPGSASIKLAKNDPYALALLAKKPEQDIVLTGYLSSGHLDLIKINKQTNSTTLEYIKTVKLQNLFNTPDQKIITKNIIINKDKVFLLLERKISTEFIHKKIQRDADFKLTTLRKNTGALLIAIKTQDLLDQENITSSMITVWDLHDINISLAQDFYIDDTQSHAIILSRAPEALYKFDLKNKTIIDKQIICQGASSLAVSPTRDRLFVPCFNDNRVLSFTLSSLGLVAASLTHGQGPAFAVVDDKHKLLYVSNNLEGTVSVYNFDLKFLGHIFAKAPRNQTGS